MGKKHTTPETTPETTTTTNGKNPEWTDAEFIGAWQTSDSVKQVAEKLHAPNLNAVFLRAQAYRRQEIPLKEFEKKVVKKINKDSAMEAFLLITKMDREEAEAKGKEVAARLEAERAARKADKAKNGNTTPATTEEVEPSAEDKE